MNNDKLKNDMLDYIKNKPCGVPYFRDNIDNCHFSIIRYIFCILKDLERRDKMIKLLQQDIEKLQYKIDTQIEYLKESGE